MNLRNRSISLFAAVVAAAVLLSGCTALLAGRPAATSAPSGSAGISREEAAELLNAVPGLSDASVGSVISGLSKHALIIVYVDEDAAITAPGVLEYVLRVGWATSFENKPGSLSLTVRNNGTLLNLQQEANVLAGVEYPDPLPYSVYMWSPEFLGAWPGEIPEPPVEATVAPATGEEPAPAPSP